MERDSLFHTEMVDQEEVVDRIAELRRQAEEGRTGLVGH